MEHGKRKIWSGREPSQFREYGQEENLVSNWTCSALQPCTFIYLDPFFICWTTCDKVWYLYCIKILLIHTEKITYNHDSYNITTHSIGLNTATLAPEVVFLFLVGYFSLQSSEKRKTSGEKRREITFQPPMAVWQAVKHFSRILIAPFPKGIKFSQLQTLFGDYFYPTNQSYHQYPVGKKSVFRHFAPEAFFLVNICREKIQ